MPQLSRTAFLPLIFIAMAWTAPPASAQIDISGEWAPRIHEDQPHRGPGPELGDYTGLPINAAARQKASTWDASILSLPERMAQPHPAQYFMRGPGPQMRVNKIIDPVTQTLIAYTLEGVFGRDDRVIWMDGRPHSKEEPAHSDDDAHEIWRNSAEWRTQQPSCHFDRTFHSAWRLLNARFHRGRSRLPRRAIHSHLAMDAEFKPDPR